MEPQLKQYFDSTILESRTKLLRFKNVVEAQKVLISAMGESLSMPAISEETKDYVFDECKKILKELLIKEELEENL
ncbi:MAG: hypothetical protein ABFD07_14165 [Methanobacterium sp.]